MPGSTRAPTTWPEPIRASSGVPGWRPDALRVPCDLPVHTAEAQVDGRGQPAAGRQPGGVGGGGRLAGRGGAPVRPGRARRVRAAPRRPGAGRGARRGRDRRQRGAAEGDAGRVRGPAGHDARVPRGRRGEPRRPQPCPVHAILPGDAVRAAGVRRVPSRDGVVWERLVARPAVRKVASMMGGGSG